MSSSPSSSCSEEEQKTEKKEEDAALEPEGVCCEIVAGGVGGECLDNINTSPTATTTVSTTSTTCSRVEPEEDCKNEFSIDVCDDTGDEAERKGAHGGKIALAGGAGALEAQVLSLLALLVQTYKY